MQKKIPKKRTLSPSLKKLYLSLFVLAFIMIFTKATASFFKKLPYFSIGQIEITGAGNSVEAKDTIKTIKGRNIFGLNIKDLSNEIVARDINIKDVKILKIFPNKIKIRILLREPLAQIKVASEYLLIDKEAVILSKSDILSKEYYLVTGLDRSLRKVNAKRLDNFKEVATALDLIKLFKEFKIDTLNVKVLRIDISKDYNINLYCDFGIEVRLGEGEFKEKVSKLALLLSRPDMDYESVRYIDLRFNDPIIGRR